VKLSVCVLETSLQKCGFPPTFDGEGGAAVDCSMTKCTDVSVDPIVRQRTY
jgi:hypothetical protein